MKNTIVGYFVVALLIAGAFALGQSYTKISYLEKNLKEVQGITNKAPVAPAGQQAPSAPAAPTAVKVKVNDVDPVKGDPKAKVAVIEYSDFQCPFCERFFKSVEPQLIKDYVDTGKIKFVYKNLAFLGQESKDSANASLCAKEQNKFWEYHDYLFNNQKGENQGAFSVANLKKFAVDLGLDTAKFNACLDTNKYDAQVQADVAEANANGLNSTPSTVVGSTPVVGAQPYEQFKAAIEAELAKAK